MIHKLSQFLRRKIRRVRKIRRIWNRALSRLAVLMAGFRPRKSRIPQLFLEELAKKTYGYTYDGLRCWKNPFDLALYTKLLSDLRPSLVIEIGSEAGGSAKWFAAQLRGLGIDGARVASFDIRPVAAVEDEVVSFSFGDIHDLGATQIRSLIESAVGPVLVVEDGPHTYEGCLAALRFFEPLLRKGDYYVVEDGNLMALGFWDLKNGPRRAIQQILSESTRYEIDYELCDFWGRNVTWNENGWLRVL